MIKIEKHDWLPSTFAETLIFDDVIRSPENTYDELGSKEKDKLRQFQVKEGEVLRVLGLYQEFSLVMRYDESIGWIRTTNLKQKPDINSHVIPVLPKMGPEQFFQKWKGVPYVWGGLSHAGIDCSGFAQLYYLQIHRLVLPKNSHDQRKRGSTVSMNELKDHDLIFCLRKDKVGTHHVVIFHQGSIWHARRTGGVVCQSLAEFEHEFDVFEVKRFLRNN